MHHPSALAIAVVIAALTLAAGSADAQSTFRLSPIFSTAQVFDTNVLSSSSDRLTDAVTRVSPGVESTYQSPRVTIRGRHTFDVERFASHAEFSTLLARQHGTVDITYRPAGRLLVVADAEMSTTETPGELAVETGLTFARAYARRLTAHGSIARRITQTTSALVDYRVTADRIAGGPDGRTQTAAIRADRRLSARSTVRAGMRSQHMSFGDTSTTSHALIAGWMHALTPRLTVSLDGGPRLTNGSVDPDMSALLRYERGAVVATTSYANTRMPIIGVPGVAKTESVTMSIGWPLGRATQVRIAPGYFRSALDGSHASVYRLTVDATRRLSAGVSVGVTADAVSQHGNIYSPLSRAIIPRRTLTVTFTAASTRSSR